MKSPLSLFHILPSHATARHLGTLGLVFLLAFPFSLLVFSPELQAEPPGEPRPASPPTTVQLTIDFGDGFQKRYPTLPWRSGMSVLDAMQLAQSHRRGTRFVYRGSGATAFLTQIDDLKNEGAGRNWVFRVNGQLGDRSFAVVPLKAGDRVLWKFGKYEDDSAD